MKKRIQSSILCLLMLTVVFLGFASVGTLEVNAAGAVSYVEYTWEDEQLKQVTPVASVSEYTQVTSSTTAWSAGWYVVDTNVTVAERIVVTGKVHLILVDGATLTASKGVNIPVGSELVVYGQTNGTGALAAEITALEDRLDAAIGGNKNAGFGTLTVHGGSVTGTILVETNETGSGAGIGGAYNGSGGTITVYGGTLTGATNVTFCGAGIGGGGYKGSGCDITVYGGSVEGTCYNDDGAAGIGSGRGGTMGNISIHGGTVEGTSQTLSSAGIGYSGVDDDSVSGGVLLITGGNVTGTAVDNGAGIGGGRYKSPEQFVISGGTVTGTSVDGAGVGMGYQANGGSLTITGGTVTGNATGSGTGVGVGNFTEGCSLTITGGTVTGNAANGRDVGGSSASNNPIETLTIYGNASITGDITNYKNSLIQSGDSITVTGSYSLPFDVTVAEGDTLILQEGATLTIPAGKTLTNNGTVELNGTVVNNGTASCGSQSSHVYRKDCVAECEICGEARDDALAHTYDSDCDLICNVCSDVRVALSEHAFPESGVCVCGANESATLVTDQNREGLGLSADFVGFYAVGNYGQFLWIRDYVNSGNTTISIVLTADIDFSPLTNDDLWVPITNFNGTFDGQFHRIKNLHLNYVGSSGVQSTLFHLPRTSTYRNVIIDSSCSFNGTAGPLVSVNGEGGVGQSYDATLTIVNCGNEATVSSGAYCAGLAVINSVTVRTNLINCYNVGTVTGSKSHGVYALTSGFYTQFYNCFNGGNVSANGGTVTYFSSNNANLHNCHTSSPGSEALTSGEIAYLLSQGVTVSEVFYDGSIWGQNLAVGSADAHPVLGGETVYNCNGYSNTNAHVYNQYGYDETNHWVECSCGAQSGEAPVAHNHSSKQYDETNHWDECVCGHQANVNVHSEGAWTSDDTHHWKSCSGCSINTIDRGEHAHSDAWTVEGDTVFHACECGHRDDVRALSYSIVFNANGGTGEMASQTVIYSVENGYSYLLPACGFTYVNNSFEGWQVSVGGNDLGVLQPEEAIDVSGDVVLTAQWSANLLFEVDPSAKDGLVYNGQAQELINSGTIGGAGLATGVIKYRLSDLEPWSEEIPKGTDADSYTVYYAIFDGNNGPYDEGSVSVTIARKSISPTLEGVPDSAYTPGVSMENPAEVPLSLMNGNEQIDLSNVEISYTNNTAVGTATVTVTARADGNYAFEPISKSFTIYNHMHVWEYSVDETHSHIGYATCVNDDGGDCIEGRRVTLTLSAPTNLTYDGTAKNATLSLSHSIEEEWSISYPLGDPNRVNAGDYQAEVYLDVETVIYVEYTVDPIELTLDWGETDLVYLGTEQVPQASVTEGVVEGDFVSLTVQGAETFVGNYSATAVLNNTNYVATNPEISFQITPRPLTLAWSNTTLTYNGEEQYPVAVIVDGLATAGDVEIVVGLDGTGFAINAGSNYTALASSNNPNYTVTNATQAFVIEKQTVTPPTIQRAPYNRELQVANVAQSELYEVSQNNGGTNVGEYDVILTLIHPDNYKWPNTEENTVTLKFVIYKRSVLPFLGSVFYNGQAQLPTLEENAPYELVTEEGFTNVGTHSVVLRLTDTVNYEWIEPDTQDPALKTASFVIQKTNNSWIQYPSLNGWDFGQTPCVPTYEAEYGNEIVQIRYYPAGDPNGDGSETPPTSIGEYIARFTVEGNDNYETLSTTVEFEVYPPDLMIGGWSLPPLHYMDTNGIISETQPEGGYAYMREDGVLVLNRFAIDASVFAESAEEADSTEEEPYAYAHLFVRSFDPTDSEDMFMQATEDLVILLIGENEIENCGAAYAIGANDGDLSLFGGSLTTDAPIYARETLLIENSTVSAPAAGGSKAATVKTSNVTFSLGFGGGTVNITDSVLLTNGGFFFVNSATVEHSTLIAGDINGPGGESSLDYNTLTVRNSHILTSGLIAIRVDCLVAEQSSFRMLSEETVLGFEVNELRMTNCEVEIKNVPIAFESSIVQLTNCKLRVQCEQLFHAPEEDPDALLILYLDNCDVQAYGTREITELISSKYVLITGGKLTLEGESLVPLISCDVFGVRDAEICITYGECAIDARVINVERCEMTLTQVEDTTYLGTAIRCDRITLSESNVSIRGGVEGISAASEFGLDRTDLEIELAASESATADSLIPAESEESAEQESFFYVGIQTDELWHLGENNTVTVFFPEGEEGHAIRVRSEAGLSDLILTAPEGARWTTPEQNGSDFHLVHVTDGETLTDPNAVTLTYSAPEEEIEDPEIPEQALSIGGVELSNGEYLDTNGNVSTEKPEGGYAHLLDGVLTLHNFTYYGIGGVIGDNGAEGDALIHFSVGIYSTRGLTLCLEGENVLDLLTFVSDSYDTYGIILETGDLTVLGEGSLEILVNADGIEVRDGDLAVSDCTLQINALSNGIDIYGDILIENCELTITDAEDDGIWSEGDTVLVDCTGSLFSGDDAIHAKGKIQLLDCELQIDVQEDGLDAIEELILIGCELDIAAESSGLESDLEIQITDSIVRIHSSENGIYQDYGALTLLDSTLEINANESAVFLGDGDLSVKNSTLTVKDCMDGLIVSGDVTVENSTLTMNVMWRGICDGSIMPIMLSSESEGFFFPEIRQITIHNSHVSIHGAEIGIMALGNLLATDSTLMVDGNEMTILIEGTIRLENCKTQLTNNENTPLVGGNITIIGGSTRISGKGALHAFLDTITLINCEMYLYNYWGDSSPAFLTNSLTIRGTDTNIHLVDYTVLVSNRSSLVEFNLDPELGIWEPEYDSYNLIFDEETGGVFDLQGDRVYDYAISAFPEDYDEEESLSLILGDKELQAGEYLDNEGNVTSEMPEGGFAFFNGSELILKNFTYEGVGSELTTVNGEAITAGIYFESNLIIRLIGNNSLSFTSENTVGIAVEGGDLRIHGSGSLTLETTGKGIDLIGDLTLENVTLDVTAVEVGINAGNATVTDATVTLAVTGEGSVNGLSVGMELNVSRSELSVTVGGGTDSYAINCQIGSFLNSSLSIEAEGNGIQGNNLTFDECNVTVEALVGISGGTLVTISDSTVVISSDGENANGLLVFMGELNVTNSTLTVTVNGNDAIGVCAPIGNVKLLNSTVTITGTGATADAGAVGISIYNGTLTIAGADTELTVSVNEGNAILVAKIELSQELMILAPENATVQVFEEGYETVVDTEGEPVKQLTVGEPLAEVDALITVGGVELSNGAYLDNAGNVTSERPEGGYAHLEDGVLTLNNFEYLAKKYNACVGIESNVDLTLVLIGENVLNSYNQTGILVKGNLTLNGNGSLTVVTSSNGIDVEGSLTVDCGGLTATAGYVVIQAREVTILSGNVTLLSTKGDKALVATDSITLGELVEIVSPENASIQRINRQSLFADAHGDALSALTLGWADHTCVDTDAVDHLCDVCRTEYAACTDANLDHTCDACEKAVGYHADTNSDHVCEYGCAERIGTCADADQDHECDYGCAASFGEHVAAAGTHDCAYCGDDASDCADADSNHICDVCGDELRHSYSDTWSSDAGLHWHACSCGDRKDVAIHVPGDAATETTAQTCTVCAYIIAPATGHVNHTAKTEWTGDETHHWHDCSDCTTQQMNKSEHVYDNSCDTACNTCGITRTVTHSYATTYTSDANDHWFACTVCGDRKDSASHTPGAAATETTAQTCTVCAYIIAPATGHTTHTARTEWESDGTHHWHACTGCSTEKLESAEHTYDSACDTDCNVCGKVRTVPHDYKDEWTADATGHWHECSICKNQINKAEHTFSTWVVTKEATESEAGSQSRLCACGFTQVEEIPMLEVEEPKNEAPKNEAPITPVVEDEGLSTGAIVAISVGSAAAVGIGGFSVWWFGISKRTFAQLGNACKGLASKTGGAFRSLGQKIKGLFRKKK